jgi:lipopolysaccharide/colanic/teichoic acid biosynthesis glycosyltransferase
MIRPSSIEDFIRSVIVVTGDFLLAWGVVAFVIFVRRRVSFLPPSNVHLDVVTVVLFAGAFIAALALSGFYRRRVMPYERPLIGTALIIQVALVAIGGAFIERPLARSVLIGVLVCEAIALPLWRAVTRMVLPVRPRATILAGDAQHVQSALAGLADSDNSAIRVIAWAGPPNQTASVEVPYAGSLSDPAVRLRLRSVEEVILVEPEGSPQIRVDMLHIRGPRGYVLLAAPADALVTSTMLGRIGDQPLIEIAVGCGYGVRAIVKRSMDIILGSILALTVLPIAVIAAVAVWLEDRRPVLIRQSRVGMRGVPFEMWKFRSMRMTNGHEGDGVGVTRVGELLRRYRIDELPQLINVITGDMSLVGPRPERPEIVARILVDLPEFELRTLVRPGIAGLAQVSARYNCAPEAKLQYDLTYMCDWSLGLDIRLLFSSVSASLAGSGL